MPQPAQGTAPEMQASGGEEDRSLETRNVVQLSLLSVSERIVRDFAGIDEDAAAEGAEVDSFFCGYCETLTYGKPLIRVVAGNSTMELYCTDTCANLAGHGSLVVDCFEAEALGYGSYYDGQRPPGAR